MRFEITKIRQDFITKARAEGLDDQGQRVKRLVAEGGEPCRDVFRRARPGEALILASYCPFESAGPYREYGPVFILAQESNEEFSSSKLPLAGVNGTEPYLREQFVLRAYNAAEEIVGAEMVNSANAEQTIERMLSAKETAFIHARFPTYGCYSLRIER